MLLTADWHLDDNPANEYRWHVFDHVAEWAAKQNEPEVYILGDLTDKKDRHSAKLVNRLVSEFRALTLRRGCQINIIMGNHDKPTNGPPFWSFLSGLDHRLAFHIEPHANGNLLLLPFSADPREAWKNIPFARYDAIFMHQTVTGAIGNNGIILTAENMVSFPVKCKVYSGDIHTTQTVKRVTYVGAPHPVAFGDVYPPQMMELADDYTLKRVIPIPTVAKHVARVRSTAELDLLKTRPFDQARVIYHLPVADCEQWGRVQDEITAWAKKREIELFSIEPEIEGTYVAEDDAEVPDFEADPAYILSLFAEAESIDDRMLDAGLELLKETK